MTETPTPPAVDTADPTQTALYRLIREKLGRDPIEYARERREAGLSWARIADEVKTQTGEYLTPEALRRWDSAATARETRTAVSPPAAA